MSDGDLSMRYKAMQAVKDWDRTRLAYRTVKRAFDIVFSGCVLAVIAIPSLILAAAMERTGSIVTSMCIHFIINAVSMAEIL